MPQRPASLFGYEPVVVEPEAVRQQFCDGDCPPWWAILTLHVAVGECTPMTAMWLQHWHHGHRGESEIVVDSAGLLQ